MPLAGYSMNKFSELYLNLNCVSWVTFHLFYRVNWLNSVLEGEYYLAKFLNLHLFE